MAKDSKVLELKDLVAKLRDDLQATMDEGADRGIKFKPETIELELKVVAKQTGEGKTGVKFWIASADVSGKIENEHTQTIKLKLVPQRAADDIPASDSQQPAANRDVLISQSDKSLRG